MIALFPDKELLTRIKKEDINAFEKLYFDMHPRLFAFSRKFIDDAELSKDIVQEVFFEFWEGRNVIDINTSLKSYLFRMIHNKCLNHIRSQKIHNRYTNYTEIKLKQAELLFYDEDPDAYESIFFKEIQKILDNSILELPESCREVFTLSRLNGLSNKEIAEKLNISVRTVENQVYRALKILKEKLKDYIPIIALFLPRLF
jgi:RNA polymerase sigma-70 factor, ECF subfamily